MITKVKVPKLSENVEEVTITGWFRKEGQSIQKGEPLVEMTTDKASFELESPRSGIVRKIIAKEKSVLPTGYVVALVGDASAPLPDVAPANARLLEKHLRAAPSRRKTKTNNREPITDNHSPSPIRATPAARRLAREKGIDLARLKQKTQAEVITEEIVKQCLNGK